MEEVNSHRPSYNTLTIEVDTSTVTKMTSTSKNLSLGKSLKICHLNIEGISQSKSDYLSRIMNELNVDVIHLQETHATSRPNLLNRGTIHGYTLIDATYSRTYGIATYIHSDYSKYKTIHKTDSIDLELLVIDIDGVLTANIYKPPNSNWQTVPLPVFVKPTIYCGDFNSHHHSWGYDHNDLNGNKLAEWINLNNLELVFSPKDLPTFKSARWGSQTTPDLTIVTKCDRSNSYNRTVLHSFPHSQHRPVIFEYGLQIHLTTSIPKPRWNFQIADWKKFSSRLEVIIQHIPCHHSSYARFIGAVINAAKRNIPRGFRKTYIPGWNRVCDELHNTYQLSFCQQTATNLLKELDEHRQKTWGERITKTNFKHSSRKAWNLLRKLGAESVPSKQESDVTANQVASRLVKMTKNAVPSANFLEVKRKLKVWKSICTADSSLSSAFSMKELDGAISCIKMGKAAGFDGIYPVIWCAF